MLVFDGIIFSLQGHGGISVYFSELLTRFATLECTSKVLMFGDNQVSLRQGPTPLREHVHARILERYRNLPLRGTGLFHSSYYRYATGGGFLNITTVYDFTYERFVNGPKKWGHSWQKFKAIRHADAVLCISENTKADLQKYLPDMPENRIYVTPLAANPAFRSAQSSADPDNYVVFVGARGGYKNFLLLVRALAHLPEVRLFVVGGGEFSVTESSLLERLIPGRYFHQGNVPTERLKGIYNRALCLVYPSAYEGFGIPVLEAMSAACPVIALRSSSIPEVAGDAAVLLDAPDEKHLSDAVQQVSRSDVRRELTVKGLERSQLFSWDATFDKTRTVYEILLGRTLRQVK